MCPIIFKLFVISKSFCNFEKYTILQIVVVLKKASTGLVPLLSLISSKLNQYVIVITTTPMLLKTVVSVILGVLVWTK